ncbi:cupredoxin domain-containing protein [Dictyobacter arantiisoli]|nr:plastocyanin/azurin family copper-binding protein [Dictyobacter arantiisoli]
MNRKILFGLLALTLMTILLSACRVIDADTIPKNPAAHMGSAQFLLPEIDIQKGQKLDLVDDVAVPHTIKNGTWNSSTPDTTQEAGAPSVNLNFTGGDRSTIGPFNQAGTFKIYCTIHGGMKLTIVVK